MRVLLTSEARFERTPDGMIWGPAAYGAPLWTRYLDVFSAVLVAARISDVGGASPGSVEAAGPGVGFLPIPPYSGVAGLVRHVAEVHRRARGAVQERPALILRTPSPLAYFLHQAAFDAGWPFGAEVVGDPRDVFSPGAYRHPLRTPIRRVAAAAQKRVARRAAAVLYVTAGSLQRRYPTAGKSYAASDAALDDAAFSAPPRREWTGEGPFVLVTVAALDQPYKGTAFLLEAVGQLRSRGLPVGLRLVGAGRLLPQLRGEAARLGVSRDVEFLGQQDRDGVRRALDSAHLFVLPSLTEGLPRALLEAMARGLPAIATEVGGVPELLPSECLVPPRDAEALARRIAQEIGDDAGRRRHAEANRRTALGHHERLGTAVRRQFLQTVRDASAAMLRGAA